MIHSQLSILTLITCVTLSLCLSACNNDNDLADIPTNNIEPLVGIWQAPGKSTFVDSKKVLLTMPSLLGIQNCI